jgi:hypothetical protein
MIVNLCDELPKKVRWAIRGAGDRSQTTVVLRLCDRAIVEANSARTKRLDSSVPTPPITAASGQGGRFSKADARPSRRIWRPWWIPVVPFADRDRLARASALYSSKARVRSRSSVLELLDQRWLFFNRRDLSMLSSSLSGAVSRTTPRPGIVVPGGSISTTRPLAPPRALIASSPRSAERRVHRRCGDRTLGQHLSPDATRQRRRGRPRRHRRAASLRLPDEYEW